MGLVARNEGQWRVQVLLYPFIALSAIGLAVSIVVHLLAHLGYAPLGQYSFILHVGIFVVWLPAVLTQFRGGVVRLQNSMNPRAGWRWFQQMTRRSPKWMQWMTAGFFVYGFANFALFMAVGPGSGPANAHGGPATPTVLWGFSGHWMIFYSAALTLLYSAAKTWNAPLKCPSGHPVSPMDRFCPECGAALTVAGSGAPA